MASKKPDLEIGLTDEEINNLPTVKSIATTGFHYLLPIVVLLLKMANLFVMVK